MRLPLFPLRTVLVPGLVLPLNVFEERYQLLVQALLSLPEGAPRQFGVVALRTAAEVGPLPAVGETALDLLHGVGCSAELREVTPYSDGRFEIVTVGASRFRLAGLDLTTGTPYLTGLVDFLPEPDGVTEPEELSALRRQVEAQFADYRRRLGAELTDLPDDARVVSYLVAAAMVLELPHRQRLLELTTTAERLRAEVTLLRRERSLVSAFGALPAIDLGQAQPSAN